MHRRRWRMWSLTAVAGVALAACGASSSGGRDGSTALTPAEDPTSTTTPTGGDWAAEGTQVFSYAGDEVSVTLQVADPLAGGDATAVYCPDGVVNPSAPADGQLVVPFRLTYELTSESDAPGNLRIAMVTQSAWLEDPDASTYDGIFSETPAAFQTHNEQGIVAFDLDGGPSCGQMGGVTNAVNVTVTPGEPTSTDGWVVFPRAVDRFHPDGDPRLVPDVQAELGISIDGAEFEFTSATGPLTEGACARPKVDTSFSFEDDEPLAVPPFLRLSTNDEPWCRDGIAEDDGDGTRSEGSETGLEGLWVYTDSETGEIRALFVLHDDGTSRLFSIASPEPIYSSTPGQAGIDETIEMLDSDGAPGTWTYDDSSRTVTAGSDVAGWPMTTLALSEDDSTLAVGSFVYRKADSELWPGD